MTGAEHTPAGGGLSRRRLFQLGGAAAGVAALLAACGNDEAPAPGRVGNAPPLTEPPDEPVDDVVLLRTLTSLEHSIVAAYDALAGLEGLDEGVAGALARFTEDHTAAATALAGLTTSAGGEPFECTNPWLMRRTLQPAIDHIAGTGEGGIAPTDDATRDAAAMANALETLAAASAQLYVTKLSDPALRQEVIVIGTQAGRRSAIAALLANAPPEGFVSPTLINPEQEATADAEGFMPVFAIPARFGQLTPIELQVGAPDDIGTRYNFTLETPAENAYAYTSESCET